MRVLLACSGLMLMAAAGWMHGVPGIGAANVAIDVEDDFYEDSSGDGNTTIAVGDTVTWTWRGSNSHTVTSDDGTSFDSGNTSQTAGTFAHTFNAAGSFDYHCNVHGTAMSGTITVQAAPTATNTTTQATATRTSEASSTPVTATSTPAASTTPVAGATLPVDPTAEAAAPISAPAPQGGAGAGVGAPTTGDGSAFPRDDSHAAVAVLGVAGIGLLGAAGALHLRRR
jgi:plastocyanin